VSILENAFVNKSPSLDRKRSQSQYVNVPCRSSAGDFRAGSIAADDRQVMRGFAPMAGIQSTSPSFSFADVLVSLAVMRPADPSKSFSPCCDIEARLSAGRDRESPLPLTHTVFDVRRVGGYLKENMDERAKKWVEENEKLKKLVEGYQTELSQMIPIIPIN
jgi:hypothetical protein